MATINIGILAHVDAGKTTLTERILFETGIIRAVGSVDRGTTQTDTMELERARGITIRSAVVSFPLSDLKVNLIDTPGHGDFIAEVERSLGVLDGVVLVLSAVEGVQSQTRRLARAIRASGLPTLIFVNKIDRLGARDHPVLDDIRRKLGLRVLAMNDASGLGGRSAAVMPCDRESRAWRVRAIDLLAETSDHIIQEFDRTRGNLSAAFIDTELRAQVAACSVVPVYFGSAITGAGVRDLLTGIECWLPVAAEANAEPASATVFKITRAASGEKLVHARVFSGALMARQRVELWRPGAVDGEEPVEGRVTGIDRFVSGAAVQVDAAGPGEIVRLHGLRAARIGDRIGSHACAAERHAYFPLPVLESVVRPRDPAQVTHLRAALEQLAEQDPLIALRQHGDDGEITVRLYGEVQKEVLVETLAREFGVPATFGSSRTVCVERPNGTGERTEVIFTDTNPFYATVGLRVEPAEPRAGVRYVRELGALPLALYRAIEETIYETLTQGLSGWEVTDCTVTLTRAGFNSVVSTAGDFRKLVPLVLVEALRQAGTEVCEPVEEMDLEIPEDTFGQVCGALVNARATIRNAFRDGPWYRVVCEIPTAELHGIEQQLPGLTRGDVSWGTSFAGHVPITGVVPVRARVGPNPLDRAGYLADVARRLGS